MARITPSVSTLALRYVAERVRMRELTGKSPRCYRHTLIAFAAAVGNPPAGQLTRRHVDKWRAGQDVGQQTQRNRLSIVRTFCAWLILNGHLQRDPTLGIKAPPAPRMVPRALQGATVGQLLERLPDVRARFIALLMVQEGLRCVEVANLQAGDFDVARRFVKVVGKGADERVLPLSDETIEAFHAYVAEHPMIAGPLIRSYYNDHRGLGQTYISTMMSHWMSAAGIKRYPRDGVSAHALRHTAATDALDEGATVREVQEMLGHASLDTTQRYLLVRPASLRAAMGGRRYGLTA